MDADDLRDLIHEYAESEREYHNSIDGSAAEKNALAERNEAMHCAITGFTDWVKYGRRLGDKLAKLPPDFEWVSRSKPYRLNELMSNYEHEIRGLRLTASELHTVERLLRTFADTAWETAISEVTRAPRVLVTASSTRIAVGDWVRILPVVKALYVPDPSYSDDDAPDIVEDMVCMVGALYRVDAVGGGLATVNKWAFRLEWLQRYVPESTPTCHVPEAPQARGEAPAEPLPNPSPLLEG